jgi:hypothetical protein
MYFTEVLICYFNGFISGIQSDYRLWERWRKCIGKKAIWTQELNAHNYACVENKLFDFFPEGGVGLVPKRGCLLTLAYYALPRWYEFGERRWNYILTGKNRRTRRKTCPSATLSTTNLTGIDSGANPGLRGERPATNNLSHGTAQLFDLLFTMWDFKFSRRRVWCSELSSGLYSTIILHGSTTQKTALNIVLFTMLCV